MIQNCFIGNAGAQFANCLLCNERGHLIKSCPQTYHGIDPKVLLHIINVIIFRIFEDIFLSRIWREYLVAF